MMNQKINILDGFVICYWKRYCGDVTSTDEVRAKGKQSTKLNQC